VDPRGSQDHLSHDPLLHSISSQTTILIIRQCALPALKQVLCHRDPGFPMEDLLLLPEDILVINLLLQSRAPQNPPPYSPSHPHRVNLEVDNRLPSRMSSSVLLFRW